MATDGFVQVPPDTGTGKRIDTDERINFAGQTVERQRVIVPDGVVVSGDALDRIWTEQRVQNLLLAQAFGIADNLNTLGDLAAEGFGGPLTQLICPLLIGGVSSTSTLTLESTSGVGTTDSIIFKTGNQVTAGFFDTGGNLSLNFKCYILSTAGGESELQMHANSGFANFISGFKPGGLRWAIDHGNSAIETGGNVGSDWQIERYTDGGVFIDVPFQITRASGLVSVTNSLNVGLAATINSSGSSSGINWLVVNNLSGFNDCFAAQEWTNDTAPFILKFKKSRATTVGTSTIVVNGDQVGSIYYSAADGTAFQNCAEFAAEIDAAPTAGQVQPSRFRFLTSPGNAVRTERLRIDSNGVVIIGGTSAQTGDTRFLQVVSSGGANNCGATLYSYASNGQQPDLILLMSQTNTVGGNGAVTSGNALGRIGFYGNDSAANRRGATIIATADATFTSGSAPTRLTFGTTASGATSDTERMRIDNGGRVYVNQTASSANGRMEVAEDGNVRFVFGINGYNASLGVGSIRFTNTRATTPTATGGAMVSGDSVSILDTQASDGTTYIDIAKIIVAVDGTVSTNTVPSRIVFSTTTTSSPTERVRIDSSGNFIIGGASAQTIINAAFTPLFQVLGITDNSTSTVLARYSNDASGAQCTFGKSRGATIGSQVATAASDLIAALIFQGSDGTNFRQVAQIRGECDGATTSSSAPGRIRFVVTPTGSTSVGEVARIDNAGNFQSAGTIGYSSVGVSGVGGAVTQATSRTTGVTLNKICGAITLFAAAPTVGTWVTFTVTNSTVAATDTPIVAVKSGTNTYIALVSAVAAGSFNITFQSVSGTTSDSPVINFSVFKAVAS